MIVLVDIDGTCADCSHRLPFIQQKPKDWKSFHAPENIAKDTVIPAMKEIIRSLAHHTIVYVTGRSDARSKESMDWLIGNGFPSGFLYCRVDGDYRQDYEVKADILELIKVEVGSDFLCAIEDRSQVVKMWRSKGILTLQCADGDY